jgi:hypothetical protein
MWRVAFCTPNRGKRQTCDNAIECKVIHHECSMRKIRSPIDQPGVLFKSMQQRCIYGFEYIEPGGSAGFTYGLLYLVPGPEHPQVNAGQPAGCAVQRA